MKKEIIIKKRLNDDEIKILEKLKNVNYVEMKKMHFMEYTKYGNLIDFQKKILKRNKLSETFLCFLAYQILNGLKYIHMCNIVHMDIKPQNILIDDFLNVKLYDFSVALDYSDYSKINNYNNKLPFIGTCFYMPPEIIKNEIINIEDLNKIDLYSLGIILYYLSFGHYLFEINKEDFKKYDEIDKEIMKGFIIKSNNYSSYFIDFLQNLLEKDINKRININEALNHYWIKGCTFILDEKEKIDNDDIFLKYLINDHIRDFNDYIFNNKKKII